MALQDTSISQYFSELSDPREEGRISHYLSDILTIVLCSVISGAEGCNDIELLQNARNRF
jgi:hypothetical protein